MTWLADWLIATAKRDPFFHLVGYMQRFHLLREHWWTFGCSIRLHEILRDDADRHLHCHPWPSLSVILRGGYFEIMPIDREQSPELDQQGALRRVWRGPGSVILRRARDRHRLELPPTPSSCWSIFLMGRPAKASSLERQQIYLAHVVAQQPLPGPIKYRSWGFWTPRGWVFWRRYLNDWQRADEGKLS